MTLPFIQLNNYTNMKAERPSFKNRLKHWLITKILVLLIRFIGITTNVKQMNSDILVKAIQQYGGVILATWHANIFFSIWLLKEHELTALISSSEDGEIIHNVFSHYGFTAVRGSTTRGGIPALKQLINLLKGNTSVAITPDGPIGPPEKIQSGVILLAKYAGVPIIPWHYEPLSQWRLNSWDKHKIPKPFTSVIESFGNPFHVPKTLLSEDVPFFCEKLENILQELVNETIQEISITKKESKY